MKIFLNLFGIGILLSILYIISSHKGKINKKLIFKALAIQFCVAFLLVKFPLGREILQNVSNVITKILGYGSEGLSFVFGSLADSSGATGRVFGIQILCNIIYVSALVAALHYMGVIGFIVKGIGGVIGKVLGTSQVESFVAVANMFLGQTDSPILVSKYIGKMTESEIMLILISGMGSMSANVVIGYVGLGIPMEYLLIAGALVPLGSIVVSKILLPETKENATEKSKSKVSTVAMASGGYVEEISMDLDSEIDEVSMDNKGDNPNLISAISEGAMGGVKMVMGIGASLIAITSLVALVNGGLGIIGLSLEQILSYAFAPIGFFMGLPSEYILTAGELLGNKIILNEFIAFGQLGTIISNLDYRTGLMLTISLAGFANIASMGMCITGIGAFCPEKKSVLSKLAFRGMMGGFCVSILSALIVGLIVVI